MMKLAWKAAGRGCARRAATIRATFSCAVVKAAPGFAPRGWLVAR
jgi:hypothetical protein